MSGDGDDKLRLACGGDDGGRRQWRLTNATARSARSSGRRRCAVALARVRAPLTTSHHGVRLQIEAQIGFCA